MYNVDLYVSVRIVGMYIRSGPCVFGLRVDPFRKILKYAAWPEYHARNAQD